MYIFSVSMLFLTFKKELTLSILLQNSIFFLYISYLLFKYFIRSDSKEFNLASKVTYIRISISVVLFTAAINSNIYSNIFNIFYIERIFILLALISLLLDGLDGFIARKYNQVTEFGELIDQEADNFLILIMTISLYLNRDVDFYIFLIPAYRYIFIFLMAKYAWLKRRLPESHIRKLACVLTIIFLIIAQESHLTINSTFLVNLALFIITFSFSRDIIWLYRKNYEKL